MDTCKQMAQKLIWYTDFHDYTPTFTTKLESGVPDSMPMLTTLLAYVGGTCYLHITMPSSKALGNRSCGCLSVGQIT